MNELLNKTLSQIVTENYQAATVFENHGLDFCCKGKRPLRDALKEKQIDPEVLLKELDLALSSPAVSAGFNEMSLTELAEYIVRMHHNYVKQNAQPILDYSYKVATKHGDHFPYMIAVHNLFSELKTEMDEHMLKEEKILFPRIKLMDITDQATGGSEYLRSPIDVMEEEHDHAGTLMQQIRDLTNNYEVPEQACTTFKLTLASLKAFEEDLHQHVHLENNILFPKAIGKQSQLSPSSN